MMTDEDLIHYEYHGVQHHRPMSRRARAAQFAPFAALAGYKEAVAEAARYTEEIPEFSDEQRQELDLVLQDIYRKGIPHPRLRITYFIADERKKGGSWKTCVVRCKRLEATRRCLVTTDDEKIPFDSISEMAEI